MYSPCDNQIVTGATSGSVYWTFTGKNLEVHCSANVHDRQEYVVDNPNLMASIIEETAKKYSGHGPLWGAESLIPWAAAKGIILRAL